MSGDTDKLAQIERALSAYWAVDPKWDTDWDVAAKAALETLVEIAKAARVRVEYGHNDTCDLLLGDSTHPYPCVCGHHELREALSALDGHLDTQDVLADIAIIEGRG